MRKSKVENHKSFKTELSIAIKLDHPNIIRIEEFYEDLDYFYIVMEYCEGGEFLEFIADEKRLDKKTACHFFS